LGVKITASKPFGSTKKSVLKISVRFFSAKLYFVLYEKFICNIFEFFGT